MEISKDLQNFMRLVELRSEESRISRENEVIKSAVRSFDSVQMMEDGLPLFEQFVAEKRLYPRFEKWFDGDRIVRQLTVIFDEMEIYIYSNKANSALEKYDLLSRKGGVKWN